MALMHGIVQVKLENNQSNEAPDHVIDMIEKLLMQHGLQGHVTETFRSKVKPLLMLIAEDSSRITVELYQDGLVVIDVVQVKDKPLIKDLSVIEEEVVKAVTATVPQRSFVVAKGAAPYYLYSNFGDHELEMFNCTSHLYSCQSPYQQIDIYHTAEYGAILFLDYDNNLAESDMIYTKTLTGSGVYDMSNCNILILGGGDGAALKEVLTYSPNMVTMIEIDKMVMDAVRQHMRGVCGDVLDQLKGDNHEIIIDDCVPVLKEFIGKGRLFDYIIYDLTEIPVSTSDTGGEEQLKFTILDLAIKLLSPQGVCIAQGHRAVCTKSLNMFAEQLKHLHCPVEYTKQSVFIHSYRERWTFYSIWK